MSEQSLNFYKYGNEKAPKNLVILLHGYGSNGQDLISLAPEWAGGMADTLFISPDAPFPCEMSGLGFQWFSLENRRDDIMIANIQQAVPLLNNFIATCAKTYNIAYDKIALVGFSQGTMMSLYVAPRHDEVFAGVLGYSGALLDGQSILDAPDNYKKFPISLRHGDADEVVPVEMFEQAHAFLQKAGYSIEGHIVPGLGHGIDQDGVASGLKFLKKALY
jgi:phospholipase/carboxylesterase